MVNAEEIFRKPLHDIAKDHNYVDYSLNVTPISSGGANYMSTLFVATISAPQKDKLQLFGKVANIAEALRQSTPMTEAYHQEHFFYTELLKIYKDLEEKHSVPKEHRLVFAKCYRSSIDDRQETVVLENLLAAGYKLYDRMKSMTWEYAAKAVEVLAKFHALSFAYSHESPEEFKKIRGVDFETAFGDEKMRKMFVNNMINLAFTLIRTEENEKKVRNYFFSGDRYKEWAMYYKPVTRAVLAHGDYRVSNLMYRRRNGHIDIIPVDFQTLLKASPVLDLMLLIYLGTDAQFRKLYYNNLLEHYYRELKLALQRLNVDIEEVYPRKDYETDLNAMKVMGLLLAMTSLSIVTVNEEDTPEMALEMTISPSNEYRRRLNEIVDEYAASGLID